MVKYKSPGTRAKVLVQGTPAEHGEKPDANKWYWDTRRQTVCFAIGEDGHYLLVRHINPLTLPTMQIDIVGMPLNVHKSDLENIKEAVEFQL